MGKDVQDMLGASVERMFGEMVIPRLIDAVEAGEWPLALWQAVEQAGFTQVLAAEEGEETPWENALPLLHAIGFHRAPLPLSETIVANALLTRSGLAARDGPLALHQHRSSTLDALELRLEKGQLVLQGTANALGWARHAAAIVVVGRLGAEQVLGVVAAGAPGLRIEAGKNMAGEPRDAVQFAHCACESFAILPGDMPNEPAHLMGALARAAMVAGAAQSVLLQSVAYANDRVQFGRPIGKFQAIQQSLAILAGEVTSARSAVAAACLYARPLPQSFDVAVAKIRAGQAAGIAAGIAHQVHGAIGFTHEHSLHYATRRLWSWRAEFGGESAWAAQLGRQAIAAGGGSFWRDLTARQTLPLS